MKALLEAGADIENGYGDQLVSPAHVAAFHGSTDVLQLLLAEGANPHVGSDYYGSLIYAAAFEGHRETVKALIALDLGIDIQA
ncbi:MAG: ankyrin repeat domain-containing protein, partial [Myxococcota bacterium]